MMMKVPLRKGARVQDKDGYSGKNEPVRNLSAIVTALLNQVESKK